METDIRLRSPKQGTVSTETISVPDETLEFVSLMVFFINTTLARMATTTVFFTLATLLCARQTVNLSDVIGINKPRGGRCKNSEERRGKKERCGLLLSTIGTRITRSWQRGKRVRSPENKNALDPEEPEGKTDGVCLCGFAEDSILRSHVRRSQAEIGARDDEAERD